MKILKIFKRIYSSIYVATWEFTWWHKICWILLFDTYCIIQLLKPLKLFTGNILKRKLAVKFLMTCFLRISSISSNLYSYFQVWNANFYSARISGNITKRKFVLLHCIFNSLRIYVFDLYDVITYCCYLPRN